MANLLREIIPTIDAVENHDEILEIFMHFYTSGSYENDRVARFGRRQGEAAIIVKCNANGRITNIEPGPDFAQSDVKELRNKINADALTDGPVEVARAVLFCSKKVDGYFRHKDSFQILPVFADCPQPEYASNHYPCLLEVSYISSPYIGLNVNRSTKALRETQLRLTPLLPDLIQKEAPHVGDRIWAYGISQKTGEWFEEYAQIGYRRLGTPFGAFSDIGQIPAMKVWPYQPYYGKPELLGDTLSVPSSMSSSLAKIEKLSPDNYEKYVRAAYWLARARLDGLLGGSVAFLAFVSAIEALIGEPPKGPACGNCKQPTGKGNTALFKEFIDAHTSKDSVPNALKNSFYELRSNLSHGSSVFRSDLFESRGSLRGNFETSRFYSMSYLANLVVYNWLQQVQQPDYLSIPAK